MRAVHFSFATNQISINNADIQFVGNENTNKVTYSLQNGGQISKIYVLI